MFSPDAGRARAPFLIALIVALIALGISHYDLTRPTPIPTPRPTSAPVPPTHFALDDLNLGPAIRLIRFIPDFDLYPDHAVEGADGLLYVAYYPNRPPSAWGFEGGEASRLGVLKEGQLQPVVLTKDDVAKSINPGRIDIEGLEDGQPVISINDGPRPEYVRVSGVVARPLGSLPKNLEQPGSCIAFDGGRICSETVNRRWAVRITLPNRAPIVVVSASYLVDRSTVTKAGLHLKWRAPEIGDVWLEGGGRRHFLLVEYHDGAAECLEGDAL